MINSDVQPISAFLGPMAAKLGNKKEPVPEQSEGDRLRLLRIALGEPTAASFAQRVGVSASRLSNVESQGLPIGKDMAQKLVRNVPGLSFEWLWWGERRGLSYELMAKLDAATGETGGLKGTTKARA